VCRDFFSTSVLDSPFKHIHLVALVLCGSCNRAPRSAPPDLMQVLHLLV
jgi:hypothetical protein